MKKAQISAYVRLESVAHPTPRPHLSSTPKSQEILTCLILPRHLFSTSSYLICLNPALFHLSKLYVWCLFYFLYFLNILFLQPYVPDFWNSAPAFTEAPKDEQLPKLLVVAGADTHPAGGPSHNLLDNGTTPEKPDDAPHQQHSQTLLDDISEDLGLPPVKELSARLRKLFS
jgi:hypothetical protein